MKNFNTTQTLQEFKIGNVVSIINFITGQISYQGTIIALAKNSQFNKEYNRYQRPAVIKVDGGVKCNNLATAILVK